MGEGAYNSRDRVRDFNDPESRPGSVRDRAAASNPCSKRTRAGHASARPAPSSRMRLRAVGNGVDQVVVAAVDPGTTVDGVRDAVGGVDRVRSESTLDAVVIVAADDRVCPLA